MKFVKPRAHLPILGGALLLAACAHHLDAPREFAVFFQSDQSTLTSEGQQVVKQIADNARALGPSRIVVAGRADGATPHDAALADERAVVVMHQLQSEGISPGLMEKQADAPPAGVRGVAAHEVVVRLLP